MLATPALGFRLFGEMGEPWRSEVQRYTGSLLTPQLFPPDSWPRIGQAFVVCALAAWRMRAESTIGGRLLTCILVTAAGGLAVSAWANEMGYRLLIQAQTHRALWMLEFAAIPAGIWLGVTLFREPSEIVRLAGIAVLYVVLVFPTFLIHQLWVDGGVLLIALLASRGLEREPRRRDWLSHALACTLVLAALVWGVNSVEVTARAVA